MLFPNKNNFSSLQELIAEQLSSSFRKAQGSIIVAPAATDNLTAVPNQYLPFDAEGLYQRLVMANLDVKGNMASCYGNYGTGVIITAGFEFADLICPGLAKINLSGSVTAERMSTALLIIQRNMPTIFVVKGATPSVQAIYDIPFPVTYLTMSGQKNKLELKLQANFQAGLKIFDKKQEKPESLVAAALQLDLTANLSASITGIGMHVMDPSPGIYPHWMDSGLQKDFKNSLGAVNPEKLKTQATDYYDYVVGYALEKLSHTGDPTLAEFKAKFTSIAKSRNLKDKIHTLSVPIVKKGVAKALENEEAKTQAAIKKLDPSNKKEKAILEKKLQVEKLGGQAIVNVWGNISKPELKNQDFENLKALFLEWNTASLGHDKELNTIIEKLEWDITQLKKAETSPDKTSQASFFTKIGDKLEMGDFANRALLKNMSFLTYTSFVATAGSKASITVGTDLSYKGTGMNAKASSNAELTGQMGSSLYRFQTFSNYKNSGNTLNVKGNMILTQDVAITYRQVLASAAAGITFKDKFNKNIKGNFTYNQITYSAAQVYWLLEREAIMRPTTGAFNLLSGSGVSYGFSVRPEALSDLCKQISEVRKTITYNTNRKKYKRNSGMFYKLIAADYQTLADQFIEKSSPFDKQLLTSIAAALHVTSAQLIEFLDGSKFQEIDNSNLNNVAAILLESNYRMTNSSIKIQTNTTSHSRDDDEVKVTDDLLQTIVQKVTVTLPPKAKTTSKLAQLSSIRIRFRTADYTAANKTLFKLGINLGVNIGIEFKKISEAGLDGIIDVYTYWYPPFRHLFEEPDDILKSQMVPPVSLFFQ